MRRQIWKKIMSFTLMLTMMLTMLYIPLGTAYAATESTWTLLEDIDAAVAASEAGTPVAITMTTENGAGTMYALPAAAATNAGPAAALAEASDDKLTLDDSKDAYGWTFTKNEPEGGSVYYNISGFNTETATNYLYVIASNNGVRVNTLPEAGANWTITDGYLTAADPAGTTRYMGVYTTTPNFRCYTSINNNIKDQKLQFWKLESEADAPDEEIVISPISEALAGANGTTYKVKGVVTLVDNANVYIQDETGGICLYFASAPAGIAVGDTVIGTGSKTAYRGLPELGSAEFEKVEDAAEKIELKAKETTLGALTDADICTYVTIKDLTVTGVSGNNVNVKDASGATGLIYKPVLGDTVLAENDVIDFTGAVGMYNSYQLRNSAAADIVKHDSTEPDDPDTPDEPDTGISTISEALAGETGAEFTVRGVTTMVDGKNVYIQDETGGICMYLSTAPTDLGTGVTVEFTGTRAVYRGLPELTGSEYTRITEEADQIELKAKEAAIGDLTTADVCTYVSIKDLTVTEVYDNNGAYSAPNITVKDADGKTIQIYKAQISKTDDVWDIAVDDVIDFTGAVGINNTTIQLRNTFASEIVKQEIPVIETAPISEALAGAAGTEFTVKGVITMVDGRNVYIQDETGGIDMYLSAASSELALGDTVIFTGTRATYRGLPELTGSEFTKVTRAKDKIELKAKEAAIGDLTTADVCTYVSLKDLTVTEVFDNNGAYANPNITVKDADGKTIQIYRAQIGKTDGAWDVAADDVIDFTGAVGINNTTIQLRNTLASEIKVHSAPSETGLVTDLTQLTDGAKVVIYNPGNAKAVASETYRDWYLTTGDVTIADDKASDLTADIVWTVGVKTTDAGTSYTFTQGDKVISCYLSGNYVEVTNNPAYNDATESGWTLDACNAETNTYYIYSDTLTTTYGNSYLEVYKKTVDGNQGLYTTGYSTGTDKLTEKDYGFQFYIVDEADIPDEPEPGETGDLITDLAQLEDGATVSIYSPGHKTAISSKPNGDWYLKANAATVENGKVTNFTADFVWKVKVNDDGTYSFYANDDETHSITVWPSGNYAELSLNVGQYPDNKWTLTPAKTANCFYMNSPTVSGNNGPAYVEAYVRNEAEVYSGYFTSPSSSRFVEKEFALQFYLVNPEDAIAAYDDGEWDGVLTPGKEYVAYNAAAESSIGLFKEANYAFDAIPTTFSEHETDKAVPGNGAYVFKVGSMGRYYSFEVNGKYLATNNSEELFFQAANEDGSVPENAKWYLTKKDGGYIIYNKECTYNGTPVCIEYYSSVFSGWTFSTKNDLNIYLFNFYEVAGGTEIHEGVVQAPAAIFDCPDFRYVEQDFTATISLDDLCPDITKAEITYMAGSELKSVEDAEVSSDGKNYTFTIPASEIDVLEGMTSFALKIDVENGYGISYSGSKEISIYDMPFFEDMTPEPNSQTGDDLKPEISVKVGNVGEEPSFTMTINDKEVDAVFENGVLSYTPPFDLEEGRTIVRVKAVRADAVEAEAMWSFTAGHSNYQMYFGQLHSHTTYSDGSGSLDTALDYIASLPESANVQYVAFTDHSNYFDTTSAANPADSLNDKSKMTDASRAIWEEYKGKVADFNAKQNKVIAIGGFEMTWSGGPGHINTFDSDGLVSRNNAELNNKTGDAGMKLYYETINKGESLNQFNHPGSTFGNFTDFSYWDEETDDHMFLVEVGNGEGQIGAGGYYPSYEEYTLALDKGWHVAPTNNQDNHKGRWGNANDARDVILTNDFSEAGIYEAIRSLRVYATEDKNLQITYNMNGMEMGTIFDESMTPDTLKPVITVYDPDDSDSVTKVELVVNGGKVAHTWDNAEEIAAGELTTELAPNYSYYYVRVTEDDGDLAVTAPVWTGSNVAAGIETFEAPASGLVGQEMTLSTKLYNNEESAATVKSLTYTTDGSKVIGTDTTGYSIPAAGSVDAEFKFTPDTAKRTTITVTAVVEIDGSEYTYSKDVTVSIRENEGALPVTPIATVQAQTEKNYEYAIEGVVTSNASGYDKDTAFFDCIYVQDDTAGICCFPVSGEYKIGDKVHIEGYTDFYQGEAELQVTSIEVIGEGSVAPKEVTAAQINDQSVLGSLVTLKGTVESFEEANGLIQTIMVKDSKGDVARVFIDGYITTSNEVKNCEVGAEISATGLASYDDTFNAPEGPFPRIRIRDRADIVCKTSGGDDGGDDSGEGGSEAVAPEAPVINSVGDFKNKSVILSWEPVSGAAGYKVSYRIAGAKKWTTKNTSKATYTVKGLKAKKLYEFRVAAFAKAGGKTLTSKWSNVQRRYFKRIKIRSAKAAGKGKVVVKWKKDKKATGYQIQYATNADMNGAKTITVKGKNKVKYTIKGLKKGRTYYVKIRPMKKYKGKTYRGVRSIGKKVKVK